ncbi:hypothetical protein [Nonomuraea zeae]|uniref:SH3 domain-containing protein n=1 Tax=Nonomuraea zeae TaxID=1642303 RepID=A0A5S4GSH7_9ACTN|nr:hypothetical protein [Nonomuraea zeae]TMR29350.1 hypothetical protein ETD85_32760 [Nonomuraea zeae]
MRKQSRSVAVLVAAGAIAAMAVAAGPAGTASAATMPGCPAPRPHNLDNGTGVMKGTFNLKTGPYAGSACGTVTAVRGGRVLYFHCWTTNRYGTRWVYARVKGTRTYGWMSIDNLRNIRGANFAPCTSDIARDGN